MLEKKDSLESSTTIYKNQVMWSVHFEVKTKNDKKEKEKAEIGAKKVHMSIGLPCYVKTKLI